MVILHLKIGIVQIKKSCSWQRENTPDLSNTSGRFAEKECGEIDNHLFPERILHEMIKIY